MASTGKADAEAYLRGLGAKDILDRATLSEGTSKPLETTMWAAAVDCVGEYDAGQRAAQDPLRRGGGVQRRDRRW